VEVTRLITNLCEQRGYRLALRFDSREADLANPDSIMQRVNEYVIYHKPQTDITAEIIAALNNQTPQVGTLPGTTTEGR
jgi:hypothetical protein